MTWAIAAISAAVSAILVYLGVRGMVQLLFAVKRKKIAGFKLASGLGGVFVLFAAPLALIVFIPILVPAITAAERESIWFALTYWVLHAASIVPGLMLLHRKTPELHSEGIKLEA